MRFKKGQSGNPNGRTPGVKNPKTLQWENLGEFITKRGAERAMKEIEKMEGKEFLSHYLMMLEYFKPKQQRTEIEKTSEETIIIQLVDNFDKDSEDR